MSILSRKRRVPEESAATAAPQATPEPPEPPETSPAGPVSRTRTSAAWLGICLAAVILVVLIIFLLQNTSSVEVSFLWMSGNVPLAIALVIAGVGTSLLTVMVGAARITQLRRRIRQHP